MYLNNLFASLADPTRRDILERLTHGQFSISQLAADYDLSFAAVAKHLGVLEKAKLIVKHRKGKEQLVSITPQALEDLHVYLARYEALWNYRFDALDIVLKEDRNE